MTARGTTDICSAVSAVVTRGGTNSKTAMISKQFCASPLRETVVGFATRLVFMALILRDDNVAVGRAKDDSAEVGAAAVVGSAQAGQNSAASASKISRNTFGFAISYNFGVVTSPRSVL